MAISNPNHFFVGGKCEGDQILYEEDGTLKICKWNNNKKSSSTTFVNNKSFLLNEWFYDHDKKITKQKAIKLPKPNQKMYLFHSVDGDVIAKRTFENGVLIDKWNDINIPWEDESEMFK